MNFSIEDILRIITNRFNPKLYWKEIIWVIVSFFVFTYATYYLDKFSYIEIISLKDNKYTPFSFSVVKFILWFIIFLITKPGFELLINFFRETNYVFKNEDFQSKWNSTGAISVKDKPECGLLIKDSQSGCLLNSHVWRNFRMNFQMIYLKDLFSDDEKYNVRRSVGILFRAQNLENYFMIEIIGDDNGDISIKPHIRMFGIWQVIEERKITKADIKNCFRVNLCVKDRILLLKIDNDEYRLILPTNNDFIQSIDSNKKSTTEPTITPDIPFKNQYGMIGFRAHPGQGAFIKDLEIKPIFSIY